MSTNLVNLRSDILNVILFDSGFDKNSLYQLSSTCKKINFIVFQKLLCDWIGPNDNKDPYPTVIGYYKKYCWYFEKKMPLIFKLINTNKTFTDAKIEIDNKLSEFCPSYIKLLGPQLAQIYQSVPCSWICEVWDIFQHCINRQFKFCEIQNDFIVTAAVCSNLNAEVELLLQAEVPAERVVESIISQPWCTKETMQLLLHKKAPMTLDAIVCVQKSKQFEDTILPLFLKLVPSSCRLEYFVKSNPCASKLLEDLDNITQVTRYEITLMLQNKYSEKSILKMLTRCQEGSKRYHIQLALENEYSEPFILELLKRCSKGVGANHIQLALESDRSEDLIEQLAKNLRPPEATISVSTLFDAAKHGVSSQLMKLLMIHMDPKEWHDFQKQRRSSTFRRRYS